MSAPNPAHIPPVADHAEDRPDGWAAPGAALVRSAATDQIPPLASLGRVHIMGIAGSGMSALARILLERGVPVSGCEARDSITLAGLRALGAQISIGHSTEHVDACDSFVYTTAINPKHEEFAYARASGKPVLRRAAALAASLEGKATIAISGTHGKTSTTSLLTVAAQACGADPSFAIGANLYETGKNAHLGTGELAIVEADESDGSFLLTRPFAAVITNVEADHLENHGDLEGIFRAFGQFIDRVAPGGFVIACADDPGARRIAEYAASRQLEVITYGHDQAADVVLSAVEPLASGVRFTVTAAPGSELAQQVGTVRVQVGALIGEHMALNATAALIAAAKLGLDVPAVLAAWDRFGGVHRRFEPHGTGGQVRVFDDYAHHPTEVAAQLRAAKALLPASPGAQAPGGRLIGVFQPGTYSRTQTFAAEFAEAMAYADIAVLMDIFPAREEPIPGITGATIADLIALPPQQVIYEPSYDKLPARIAEVARPGDLVLTMGIGNVYLLCEQIRAACEQAAAARADSSGPSLGGS